MSSIYFKIILQSSNDSIHSGGNEVIVVESESDFSKLGETKGFLAEDESSYESYFSPIMLYLENLGLIRCTLRVSYVWFTWRERSALFCFLISLKFLTFCSLQNGLFNVFIFLRLWL